MMHGGGGGLGPAAVTPIEVAAVPAPAVAETCARKVRVVYAGYGTESCKR